MINLLFDMTMLARETSTGKPTGIYYCAYNFFKRLMNNPEIYLSLYCEPEFHWALKDLLKKEFPEKKFTIISENDFSLFCLFFYNITEKLVHKFRKTKNKVLRSILSKKIKAILFGLQYIRFLNFNFAKNLESFDIFLSPCLAPPKKIKKNKNIIRFTILHDTTPLQASSPKNTRWFDLIKNTWWFKLVSNRWWFKLVKNITPDDYYFNVSAFTRQDFLNHFPKIDPEKSFVTYLAASENFKVIPDTTKLSDVKKKYAIDSAKKYIFSLCSLEERKNLVLACTAFVEFVKRYNLEDIVFVLGGVYKKKVFKRIANAVSASGMKYIQYIGYVDEEDLPLLYNGSHWFVSTSSYEGFGIPPLEAMQCGCPVIVSNVTSLPEVAGEAGIKIDYDSVEQHIEAYKTYYFNENIRKENIAKGIERAKDFSWDKSSDKMVELFRNALTNNQEKTK